MKRNQIRQIRVHFVPPPDGRSASKRMNEFHVKLLERRLNQSELDPQQKIAVIDRVIQSLKLDG